MSQFSARAAQARSSKTLVDHFLDIAFNQRELALARQYLANDFVHHEPTIAPGAEGFLAHLAGLLEERPQLRHESVRHICDGDFVVAHSRRTDGPETTATIDIFRVAGGRISEHWHVFQQVPPVMANPNGMF